MGRGVNKVFLLGRVGKDPDFRELEGGRKKAVFSLATPDGYKDKNGDWQDATHWHRVICWGKLAEIAGKHITKGQQVTVVGKLTYNKWEKDGVKITTAEVNASELIFMDCQQQGNGNNGSLGDDSVPF